MSSTLSAWVTPSRTAARKRAVSSSGRRAVPLTTSWRRPRFLPGGKLHFHDDNRRPSKGFCQLSYANLALIRSLNAFPSTRFPASFPCAVFITNPICFAEVAPVSASAATTAASSSSGAGADGK